MFLWDHHCNNICKLLQLHTDVLLDMGHKVKPAILKSKGKGKEKATTPDGSDDEETQNLDVLVPLRSKSTVYPSYLSQYVPGSACHITYILFSYPYLNSLFL